MVVVAVVRSKSFGVVEGMVGDDGGPWSCTVLRIVALFLCVGC